VRAPPRPSEAKRLLGAGDLPSAAARFGAFRSDLERHIVAEEETDRAARTAGGLDELLAALRETFGLGSAAAPIAELAGRSAPGAG